jgi:ergot alkaloid biosynthesis protein
MMNGQKILITGGTGNTGRRIAEHLAAQGRSVRTGSRGAPRSDAFEHVRFDWDDTSTHGPALEDVGTVYLVAPLPVLDPTPQMLPFIKQALESGVRRLVLLSSSAILENSSGLGKVHGAVKALAPEWAVLQPSWFMQNFTEGMHRRTIETDGTITSATEMGRVAFVDAGDIAAVAAHALTDETPHNTAHVITGPEALTYAEVAAILSQVTGKTVTHQNVSPAQLAERLASVGLPQDYAEFLAGLDKGIAQGSEDRVTDTVESVTGRAPRSFMDLANAFF